MNTEYLGCEELEVFCLRNWIDPLHFNPRQNKKAKKKKKQATKKSTTVLPQIVRFRNIGWDSVSARSALQGNKCSPFSWEKRLEEHPPSRGMITFANPIYSLEGVRVIRSFILLLFFLLLQLKWLFLRCFFYFFLLSNGANKLEHRLCFV